VREVTKHYQKKREQKLDYNNKKRIDINSFISRKKLEGAKLLFYTNLSQLVAHNTHETTKYRWVSFCWRGRGWNFMKNREEIRQGEQLGFEPGTFSIGYKKKNINLQSCTMLLSTNASFLLLDDQTVKPKSFGIFVSIIISYFHGILQRTKR